jgi:hypothetical protein
MCSDWLIIQKSSFQKQLCRFEYDMFFRWPCTSFEFLVLIKITKMATMAVFNIGPYVNMNENFSFEIT